jgi:hypothetical protein
MATDEGIRSEGRGLAAALTTALLVLGGPAGAEGDLPTAEEILALTAAGEALMAEGDYDGAYAKFVIANDATFISDDYEPLVKHYPNLVLARYYQAVGDWQNLAVYSASVASALDTEELSGHPYRTEAVLLQGIAAYEQGLSIQAEPPLRSAFRLTGEDPAMAGLHALASFYLARLLDDLGSPEAQGFRDHFFALDRSRPARARTGSRGRPCDRTRGRGRRRTRDRRGAEPRARGRETPCTRRAGRGRRRRTPS